MNNPSDNHPMVHLVGNVPLDNAEAVFRTLGDSLGKHMKRLPDGETGRRKRWVRFIHDQLKTHPSLEVDPDIPVFQFKQWDGKVVFEIELLRIKEGMAIARLLSCFGQKVGTLKPHYIRSDNGSEFIARNLQIWLKKVGIKPIQIYPGSPWKNGYNERFNGTLRREVLNAEWFSTIKQAQVVINIWLKQYNTVRSHQALNMRPPVPETLRQGGT